MMRENVSKTFISAHTMVVIIEEVYTKWFENPAQLNRNVETVLIPQNNDVKMSKFYLESISFFVEVIYQIC